VQQRRAAGIVAVAALCAGLVVGTGVAQAATRYKLVDLGVVGDGGVLWPSVNDRGVAAGNLFDAQNQPMPFLWRDGVLTPLGSSWTPTEINNHDVVVGIDYRTGLVYSDGIATPLPILAGALQSDPWTINNSGEIFGNAWFDDGNNGTRPELWRLSADGTLQDLGGVFPGATALARDSPRHGVLVGEYTFATDTGAFISTGAFLWAHGVARKLGTPANTQDAEVLDSNWYLDAVGFARRGVRNLPVEFTADGPKRLPLLERGGTGIAYAINDNGLIVGDSWNAYGTKGGGVIWKRGRVVLLNDVTHFPSDSWNIEYAVDVNNHGAIVAAATNRLTGRHLVLLKPQR
jgi:hypothetical protein